MSNYGDATLSISHESRRQLDLDRYIPHRIRPFSIAINPTGQYAYVVSSHTPMVWAYRIRGNGALAPIGTFAIGVLDSTSVAVDPTGSFLYVANHGDNAVSAYTIARNGSLTPIGTPVAVGTLPVCVAVPP